jgi:signal transduction histidine kinase
VTIRTRLTAWYAGIMFISLMAMGVLLYYQFVIQPRQEAQRRHNEREQEQADPDDFEDAAGIVLWCGIPAVMLALVGGWWLMRKSLAPVAALTAAAGKIHDRNLHEQLPRSGNGDELDRLTEVFNAMTTRLDESFQRIREFTLHASHELKTPLTVLHGEIETELRDPSLVAPHRERLASQLDEIQRLTKIVDGLTLLTKADAGQIALNFEAVALDEVVRDVFADAQILAKPTGLSVTLKVCEPVTLRGDKHRLRQLLLNLADNAIKYNQPNGSVEFSLRRDDSIAELIITNTSHGIAPEVLPRVFERFFRGEQARNSAVDGCGLGLSIVHWITTAHDGSLKIESTTGRLTTMTVRLPLLEMKTPKTNL